MKLLLKTSRVGPGLVVSTLLVSLVIGPALPDWAGIPLFFSGLTIAGVLLSGHAESYAVQALCRARKLNAPERAGMAPTIAELCQLGLGPPVVELFVDRRRGSAEVTACGRRSVVVPPEFVEDVVSENLPHGEAVAILVHAALVARLGLSSQDPAIIFWSAPWRILCTCARPLGGIVFVGWKMRYVVFVIAMGQSITAGGLPGMSTAVVLGFTLLLTYLVPRWSARWAEYAINTADRALLAYGLGPAMAAYLRRVPQTIPVIGRLRVLDSATPARSRLRIVRT